MSRLSARWFGIGLLGIVLAILGGVGYVSYREQDDAFCASCHTQPESEYYQRYVQATQTNNATDLAALHHRKKDTRCIDCHVGEGILGRATVVSLAAWDAFKYYTGIAQQPAHLVYPVQNEACVKCHLADMTKPGFENHMHNKFFDGKDPTPFIRCSDCHPTHRLGDEARAFQFRDVILPKCEYCHVQMGKGPRGLSR
jgi:hypothetical protein